MPTVRGERFSFVRKKGARLAALFLGGALCQGVAHAGEFDLWDDAPASKASLIVIDECSMVDAELGRDLISFGVPLLVLGDPPHLPPIQGGGFFTDAEPDTMLIEVHRQAADNPIVRLSMDIREGRELEPQLLALVGDLEEHLIVRHQIVRRVLERSQLRGAQVHLVIEQTGPYRLSQVLVLDGRLQGCLQFLGAMTTERISGGNTFHPIPLRNDDISMGLPRPPRDGP